MSICVWGQDHDGNWETDCDNMFVFTEDGPNENGFNYCPYCGMPLESHPYQRTSTPFGLVD